MNKNSLIKLSIQFLLFCTVKIFHKARGRTGKQMQAGNTPLTVKSFPPGPPEVKIYLSIPAFSW